MATVTASYNWVSGETVTPAKLNTTAAPTVVVADNEVTTAKILDANVTAGKLATTLDLSGKTVTLPDDSVTNDKLSLAANAGEIKKALNADNSPPIFACRAWVNFNGNRNSTDTEASANGGNVLIRASGNVSSVTKVAQGQYTVNFTTAMPDANYSTHAATDSNSNSVFSASTVAGRTFTTTSAVRIVTAFANASNNGYFDPDDVSVAIFR
jgi:flagellar hook assembly protein FlgD